MTINNILLSHIATYNNMFTLTMFQSTYGLLKCCDKMIHRGNWKQWKQKPEIENGNRKCKLSNLMEMNVRVQ